MGETRHMPAGNLGMNPAHIPSTVRPMKGMGTGPVTPCANTYAFSVRPEGIARLVDTGAYAPTMSDRTGQHTFPAPEVPRNTTLEPLPPLTPVGNIRLFIRDNRPPNPILHSHVDIPDHRCQARNGLVPQPKRIALIGAARSGSAGRSPFRGSRPYNASFRPVETTK